MRHSNTAVLPLLSRIAVRLALAYLLVGASWGLARMATPLAAATPNAHPLLAFAAALSPAQHANMMLFGALTQLTLGVAYWILPRFAGGKHRGRPWAASGSIVLLNLGVVLNALRVPGTQAIALLALGAFGWHAAPRLAWKPPPRLG